MDSSDERNTAEIMGEKPQVEDPARDSFEEIIRKSREVIARVDATLDSAKQGESQDMPG